jgi:hypothetical protein
MRCGLHLPSRGNQLFRSASNASTRRAPVKRSVESRSVKKDERLGGGENMIAESSTSKLRFCKVAGHPVV